MGGNATPYEEWINADRTKHDIKPLILRNGIIHLHYSEIRPKQWVWRAVMLGNQKICGTPRCMAIRVQRVSEFGGGPPCNHNWEPVPPFTMQCKMCRELQTFDLLEVKTSRPQTPLPEDRLRRVHGRNTGKVRKGNLSAYRGRRDINELADLDKGNIKTISDDDNDDDSNGVYEE